MSSLLDLVRVAAQEVGQIEVEAIARAQQTHLERSEEPLGVLLGPEAVEQASQLGYALGPTR